MKTGLLTSLLLLLCGCSSLNNRVVVCTSTMLGFKVAQNPANQMYQLELGYTRQEIALIPTNGVDVLTELQFRNITGQGGLYQRMAVGSEAVKQSVFVFAKDANGRVDTQTVETFVRAAHGLSSRTNAETPPK